jgi:hypothetical protein
MEFLKPARQFLKPFTSYKLAVIVADGPLPGGLAGELNALETQPNALLEGTGGYSTKLILFGGTPFRPIGALPLYHQGTLFTGNSTDTYLHLLPPGCSPPEADLPTTSFFDVHCSLSISNISILTPFFKGGKGD